MPMPPADMPRLKNRACTPNLGESGISRTANAPSDLQPPNQPPVGAIDAHDADATRRHAEVEKPRLHAEPRRVGHQPHGKCVFKGLLNFPLIQRTKLKRRVIPIELHNGSVVNKSPMQCEYNVFTHAGDLLSSSGF